MPTINEDGLSRLLKTDPPCHIWCLFGEDDYLKEFYCGKLVARTVDEQMKLFNLHVYEDADFDVLTDVFEQAECLPVMAEHTCLVVKELTWPAFGKEQRAEFAKKLAAVPESTVVILYFGKTKVEHDAYRKGGAWSELIGLVSRLGNAVDLSHRSEAKTVQMLVRGAASRGTSITPENALYLIETTGSDIRTLLNEFNKVCAYADGEPVTREMIDLTAVRSVEADSFAIGKALFAHDADRAFSIALTLLRNKTPLQMIIGSLSYTYVMIYRMKLALSCDRTAAELAETFGYKSTSQLTAVAPYARKASLADLTNALQALLSADVRSKSTAANDETLLTELLAELAAYA